MNEVQVQEPQSISEVMQLSSAQVVEQVQLIQKVLNSVMKVDEHYGVIPGTKKPTLLKAGAEKLCLTFRLSPSYEVERIDHAGGHREYIITAKLTHIPTGKVWGEGVGSCSSLEKKYRYRSDAVNTGRPVPRSYWDNGRDQAAIGGKGFIAQKDENGAWMIHESSGVKENPDLAEVYNTVLKMAKKRALVDATLNACAASDIFTQDLEENHEPAPQAPKTTDRAAEQAAWEAAKGIGQKPAEPGTPPQPTPDELAQKAIAAQRKKRFDSLPDDIKAYFRALKLSYGRIFEILDANQNDPVAVRAYIAENPTQPQGETLAEKLAGEGMAAAG